MKHEVCIDPFTNTPIQKGLRYPLAIYRNTKDEALKKQTRTAADLLAQYHTSLAGTIVADEIVSDLKPSRGSELCISAEMVFSLSWMYQYLGDNDIADWVERVAFNSLPVSISSDWWSHQYVQQENQVSAQLGQGIPLFLPSQGCRLLTLFFLALVSQPYPRGWAVDRCQLLFQRLWSRAKLCMASQAYYLLCMG